MQNESYTNYISKSNPNHVLNENMVNHDDVVETGNSDNVGIDMDIELVGNEVDITKTIRGNNILKLILPKDCFSYQFLQKKGLQMELKKLTTKELQMQ